MSCYILSGVRTPIGSFLGNLQTVPAVRLGATAISGAVRAAQVSPENINEVFMGNVIQAGLGQAPARQATIFSGLPNSTPTTTVNKVCGSGMKSTILAAQTILSGDNKLVVAGGMENMSLAPHVIHGSRSGFKFGATEMKDALQWDGLWDVYSNQTMGHCAEECVKKYSFTREQMDQYSIESFKRAQKAVTEGVFKDEIVPVTIKGKKGDEVISQDEGPFKADFDKIPKLKPAFGGQITAANASTLNDGAAALVLGGEEYKSKAQFKIVSYGEHAHDPMFFTTAPVGAMKKALDKAKLRIDDIGLFEINEAFAVVTMAAMKEFNIPHDKVNIFGGAVALGHPIGCSGARITVTLMNAMKKRNVRYGMASICIGGGEALSLIIEKI